MYIYKNTHISILAWRFVDYSTWERKMRVPISETGREYFKLESDLSCREFFFPQKRSEWNIKHTFKRKESEKWGLFGALERWRSWWSHLTITPWPPLMEEGYLSLPRLLLLCFFSFTSFVFSFCYYAFWPKTFWLVILFHGNIICIA